MIKKFEKQIKSKFFYIRAKVAKNIHTPVELLEILECDPHSYVRFCVAKNPNTPGEILQRLSQDFYYHVRQEVAKNPNTFDFTLCLLALSVDFKTQYHAFLNDSMPAEALKELSEISNRYVDLNNKCTLYELIAKSPNTPTDVLEKLKDDSNPDVRREAMCALQRKYEFIAKSPTTPTDVLEKLRNDSNPDVRREAMCALQRRKEK